ncbi:putative Polysaccharide biosynthesis protein [Vibrio crassostreae]|nr:putative Polysaccharide biosynthesis protein [Vibrio crassostreae]CAK3200157.1 putative Polysaccharide biosynthesis protein [Vibrio crassostreae]CAK3236560.1 putative Polysaccharide biosynthesis protein [Vibrio crassostreae]CAK3237647.1 putative Polysaccharide biosynthesis protein [Vibrio crassostreae]CAK3304653.1 putative Polysaccharide biosynthesis protein [Vibrio crassostreae]
MVIHCFNRKVLSIYHRYQNALSNLGYLTFFQIANMLFPFLLYPILIKAFGMELYGHVVYANGVALFFSVFISYGYNLSATKKIAENFGNIKNINQIFSVTIFSKGILFLIAIAMYFVVICAFIDKEDRSYYYYSIGALIMEFLCPIWFFQGVNKLKNLVIVNFVIKLITFLSILILVSETTDLNSYLIINMSSLSAIGIISFLTAIFYLNVRFTKIDIQELKDSFVDGWSVFLSTFLISIKDRSSIILIGAWIGKEYVVIYDLISKGLGLLSMPQNIIQTAFFPTICKNKNISEIKKIIYFVLTINTVLVFLSVPLVLFVRNEYILEVDIISYILISSTAIFIGLSSSIARFIYIPFELHGKYIRTLFANMIFFVFSCVVLFAFYKPIDLIPYAFVLFFCSIFEAVIRACSVKFIIQD